MSIVPDADRAFTGIYKVCSWPNPAVLGRWPQCRLVAESCRSAPDRRWSASWPSPDVLRLASGGSTRPKTAASPPAYGDRNAAKSSRIDSLLPLARQLPGHRNLAHIGEPIEPPLIAPARGPPPRRMISNRRQKGTSPLTRTGASNSISASLGNRRLPRETAPRPRSSGLPAAPRNLMPRLAEPAPAPLEGSAGALG